MKALKFLHGLFSDKRKEKMRAEWQNHLNLLLEKEMEEERRLEEKNRRKAIDRRTKEMEEFENFFQELEEILRLEEIEKMEKERKKRKFRALCQFFERRGYEFYTRTPMVKIGDLTRICGSLFHQRRIKVGRRRWSDCILHCDGKTLQ